MKIRLLLIILICYVNTGFAQQVLPPTGSPNSLSTFRGAVQINGAIFVPNGDGSFFTRYSDFIRENGVLKYWDGIEYVAIGSGSIDVEVDPTVPQFVKDITQGDIDRWDEDHLQNLGLSGQILSITDGNSVTLQKSNVGLGNVDNTSDLNKPISTATQTALNNKENSFSKNTAFNKNFGTTSGTVKEGDWQPTWSEVTGKPTFSDVAVSGDYDDLSNKPENLSDFNNDEGFATELWVQSQGYLTSAPPTNLGSSVSGNNVTITSSTGTSTTFAVPNTTYTAGTLPILNTGTSTTNQVWNAKVLNDWLLGKNYLVTELDPTVPIWVKNITQTNITNWNNKLSSGDNVSELVNDAGYLTSFTESDPTVPSHVKNITTGNITSWNNKENSSNKVNNLNSPNSTTYPTTQAVKNAIDNIPSQMQDLESVTNVGYSTGSNPINVTGYGSVSNELPGLTLRGLFIPSIGSNLLESRHTNLELSQLSVLSSKLMIEFGSSSNRYVLDMDKAQFQPYSGTGERLATFLPDGTISTLPQSTWLTQSVADGLYKSIGWQPTWAEVTGKPNFHAVATSGDYNDLLNKPTIPTNNNQLTNGAGYITSSALSSYVQNSRTITINGQTFDLSQNRSWTIPNDNTVTRLRGTSSGTYQSGDLTLLAGTNTSITQSGSNITINSTNTNTTYSAGTGLSLSGTTFNNTAPNITQVLSISGNNLTLSNGGGTVAIPNTTYTNMTLSELNTGTVTTGRVIAAKTLNDWLNAKGFTTNTGTVTSVGLQNVAAANPAFTVLSSPVTGSGILTMLWQGGDDQYVNGEGSLVDFPTIPIYTAGTNIQISGTNVISATDNNTTYTAGSGLSLTGTTFANTAPNATHTGDVTGSTALTIANNAVTHAKYQNISTQRILGRGTAGSGNVEELTLGANLSLTTAGVLSATNTNTTYSAGAGLTLSGTTFSLPITYSGTGNYVSAVTQTASGLTVSRANLPTIPTVGNGNITYTGTGSITGGGTSTANQTGNTSYNFDLTAGTKNDIALGVTAHGWGNHADERYWRRDRFDGQTVASADANTALPQGGAIASYSTSNWLTNGPSGFTYGGLLDMGGTTSGRQSLQLAWSSGHSGESDSRLAFRTEYGTSGGSYRAWKEIWHKDNLANGTTSQYIRGDGSLATFPNISTPNLQAVTNVGNTTTNEITTGNLTVIGTTGSSPTTPNTFKLRNASSGLVLNMTDPSAIANHSVILRTYSQNGYQLTLGTGGVEMVGGARIGALSGTGNRMVIANATGVLSTQAIPTFQGTNLGSSVSGNNVTITSSTGNNTTFTVPQPPAISQWSDDMGYGYEGNHEPQGGFDTKGGYASRSQMTTSSSSVATDVEYVYFVGGSSATLTLPNPDEYPNRVINISNNSEYVYSFTGHIPRVTQSREVGYLDPYDMSAVDSPKWIEIKSVDNPFDTPGEFVWMVVKYGR